MTVSRGRCNLPGRGSSCHQEIPRIRTALSNQGIGHGYRLNRRKDTAYFDRCLELKQHRLFKEDFSSLETKPSDLRLEQLDVLSAIFQQFVDDLVDVHLLSCIHARWKSDNLNNSKIKYGRLAINLGLGICFFVCTSVWLTFIDIEKSLGHENNGSHQMGMQRLI